MSLFGNLPPPEPEEGCQKSAEPESEEPSQNVVARRWARPELVPNFRRPKASATPNSKVPPSNPKHPHAMPQDPFALMSRWEAAAAAAADDNAGDTTEEKPHRLPPKKNGSVVLDSLAEYMPPLLKHKLKGGLVQFVPQEEYNPAAPNDYQSYKTWLEHQRQLVQEEHDPGLSESEASEDDCDRISVGEPSSCLVLTNMADAIDDELEHETAEECRVFGTVVRCDAVEDEDCKRRFGRVRVFVEFAQVEAAVKAQMALDRRFFDGRHISASFYHPS
ncbi:Splicing factor 45 [Coemansia guatemalensis]|uniref:Splicing factor 45 n=1 Tax=Coemansia guatemalensis TaxID=2761395 RepID=A0A9W8HYN4_9FUNG|nr:Splicing factor 45 [Coemansia guatemalensis]